MCKIHEWNSEQWAKRDRLIDVVIAKKRDGVNIGRMGTITVNGIPLKEHVSAEIGAEAQKVRKSENRIRRTPIVSRHTGNVSRTKSGNAYRMYAGDSQTSHILAAGSF